MEDSETLLRSIFASLEHTRVDGKLHLASITFHDAEHEVSVDRAGFLTAIAQAKRQPDAGVASIAAKLVRESTPNVGDVRPDPLGDNFAHALIHPRAGVSNNQFKKLCKALARICIVEIEPTGRDYSVPSVN